jgi:glycyl-tRNA synthetase beta chain
MARRDFLFELGLEEMPPKALLNLATALAANIVKGVDEAGIAHGAVRSFATPRRLAVLIHDMSDRQAALKIERRGPPRSNAFDANGVPSMAAIAFARSCGVDVAALDILKTDKGEWLAYRATAAGAATISLLPAIVVQALGALPIPKRMRWGANPTQFVRPVQWALMLFGAQIVPAQILGLQTGRHTRGHRFHAPKVIAIKSPGAYEEALQKAYVIADFDRRREKIRVEVTRLASPHQALMDEGLLDEVTALVEWPVPVAGEFDERFLKLPREVVISTVQHHQRYFPVLTCDGGLTRRFITVSNIESRDPDKVRQGNERVVRPRLSDAAFFRDQDRKLSLAQHAQKLSTVTYQAKLGSYADKTRRIQALAERLGPLLGTSKAGAAAQLAKADLVTAMVGEFPDLQGVMGHYYARSEGLDAELAQSLEEQYLPRFAGDSLPKTATGRALALADRLDTLAGAFAIGQKPTGTKDPFGLRRAALGILRLLFDVPLDLDLAELLQTAVANQPVTSPTAAAECIAFVAERLRAMFAERDDGISGEMFDAVFAVAPNSPVDIGARIGAANKRIVNILKKASVADNAPLNADLLIEPAERELHAQLTRLGAPMAKLISSRSYSQALQLLASLRNAVDAFFDGVMVMDENIERRSNRLALLAHLRRLIGGVADLSRLPG